MGKATLETRGAVVGLLLAAVAGCTKPNPDAVRTDADASDGSLETETDDSLGEDDTTTGDDDPLPPLDLLDTTDEVCEAESAIPGPCGQCLRESCCEELLACESDEDCSCLGPCLLSGGLELDCTLECLLGSLDSPALVALQECAESICSDDCP